MYGAKDGDTAQPGGIHIKTLTDDAGEYLRYLPEIASQGLQFLSLREMELPHDHSDRIRVFGHLTEVHLKETAELLPGCDVGLSYASEERDPARALHLDDVGKNLLFALEVVVDSPDRGPCRPGYHPGSCFVKAVLCNNLHSRLAYDFLLVFHVGKSLSERSFR